MKASAVKRVVRARRTGAGPALLAALLSLAPLPAAADPCAGSTQVDLDACAAAHARRADAAMNAAYGTLMGRIGPRARDALRAAQRAWLPFRDATCRLEAMGAEGGSMQPMVRAECRAQVTEARAKALDGYLTCGEGEPTCVGRFRQ